MQFLEGMRLSDLVINFNCAVSSNRFYFEHAIAYLTISFQPGLDFIWLNFMESSITFIAILIVPIVHASLVLRFIKYKDITQSDFS